MENIKRRKTKEICISMAPKKAKLHEDIENLLHQYEKEVLEENKELKTFTCFIMSPKWRDGFMIMGVIERNEGC